MNILQKENNKKINNTGPETINDHYIFNKLLFYQDCYDNLTWKGNKTAITTQFLNKLM